jgi:hypothetical protein
VTFGCACIRSICNDAGIYGRMSGYSGYEQQAAVLHLVYGIGSLLMACNMTFRVSLSFAIAAASG